MRTREEQISDVFPKFYAEDAEATVTKGDLRLMLQQAEQRGYERARAECAADTRRLDWLAASLIDMRIHSQQRTIHVRGPMTAFDFRQSIDIAQKVGK